MSTPEREMANLNLGGNQNVSARQAGQWRRRAREAQDRILRAQQLEAQQNAPIQPLHRSSSNSAPPPVTSNTSGITNISYNISSIHQALQPVATDALQYPPKYDVERAFERRDGSGPFYAFQIKKSETVRVYSTGSETGVRMTCSCQLFSQFKLCDHIIQIQDCLNAELGGNELAQGVLALDISSIESRVNHFFPRIGHNLHSLPDAFNFRGATESENEAEPEDVKDLQDVLSVLDAHRLPEEFDEAFREDVPAFRRSMSRMVVPGNPTLTLWGLSKYDLTLFTRLRNAVTKDHCEANLLNKLRRRADQALDRFEHYAQHGPRVREDAVRITARTLRHVISSLSSYLDERAPTSARFNTKAAALVVHIINRAAATDHDVYEPRPLWLSEHAATTQAPSDPEQRNLFARLLLSPRRSGNAGPSRGTTGEGGEGGGGSSSASSTSSHHGSAGSLNAARFFALDLLHDGRLRALIPPPQRAQLLALHTQLVRATTQSQSVSNPVSTARRAWADELHLLLGRLDESEVPGVVEPARRRPSNLEESEPRRRRVR